MEKKKGRAKRGNTLLEVRGLHKEFGGIKAVDTCSFTVEEGTIVALIGPNGAGKSTVFNMITSYLKADRGNIQFKGEDITNIRPSVLAEKGISRTFQLIRLFPKMTAVENLLIAMPDANENPFLALLRTPGLKRLEQEHEKRAHEWLRFVGLDKKANELAGNLSYGQQKLLEIAKALAQEPDLLMLDEPAAGVNPTMLKKIANLIVKLRDQGKTILFIEHDMEFVMGMADKVVVLDYGKEIAVGKPKEIQNNRRVIDAYLGVSD